MTSDENQIRFSDLTAVILAGGKGSRLSTVVNDRSKVMAEISGRPFLTYILDHLESLGVRNAVVCTGHKADELENALGRCHGKLEIQYSRESEPLGTAGAVALAQPKIESEWALVLNGDSYFTGDWTQCFDALCRKEGCGAILMAQLENCAEYGLVRTDPNGFIQDFIEKRGVDESGWINAGVYVLKKSILNTIPSKRFVSLENDMFPTWIDSGLIGCRAKGDLLDIGTPERLASAASFFSSHGVKAQEVNT
jgi:NDP-sugar pyrophosphorylase family protein